LDDAVLTDALCQLCECVRLKEGTRLLRVGNDEVGVDLLDTGCRG
jgi:hypothetical protein